MAISLISEEIRDAVNKILILPHNNSSTSMGEAEDAA